MSRHVPPRHLGAPAPNENTTEIGTGTNATRALEKIATALDIPFNAFKKPYGSNGDKARVLVENAEAADLFARITDRDARQRGLAYLRWIAEH